MLNRIIALLIFASLLSCRNEKQEIIQLREAQKKEKIFAAINAHWHFNANPMNPTSQELTATWAAWRDLLREMSQKPQSSIDAFRKKAKTLSKMALQLESQLPSAYAKPEVRSRISVLTSKINSLNLFLHLDDIPAEKVNQEVDAINASLISLQQQFDEIVRKNRIPKEQGESDMIRMLDTTRAVPTNGVFPGANTQSATPQNPATRTVVPINRTPKPRPGLERMKTLSVQ